MTTLFIMITMTVISPDCVSLFEQANSAYTQGNYDQAIEGYTTLITGYKIKSPELLHNLANAWMEKGAIGKSILYYEAALMLDPGFEPARINLEKALGATKRNLPPPDMREIDKRFLPHYYPVSPGQSLALTICVVIVSFAMLFLYHWKQKTKFKWLCMGTFILGVILQIMTVSVNYSTDGEPLLAVTQTTEAPVYFSTAETETPRFLLYEGDRVLVDRIEGDWVRVNAHGGERGWTRKDNTGIVKYGII